jgi:hypothetical protein
MLVKLNYGVNGRLGILWAAVPRWMQAQTKIVALNVSNFGAYY